MNGRLQQKIMQGSLILGLRLTNDQYEKLAHYIVLIAKWNKVYNLTSIRDKQKMVSHHILDSLTILPYISDDNLLDVGSGAGLPGIPVAIAKPTLPITLIDSNSKKTRFLQQVKAELNLTNITIVHARIEQANLPQFTTITARALSTISHILALSGKHCNDNGYFLIMKSTVDQYELTDIDSQYKIKDIVSLTVSADMRQRHILRIVKNKD